jgi:uncharacterized protein
VVAFAALTVALVTVWAPRVSASPHAASWWVLPFTVALVAAQFGAMVATPGLVALFVFVTACRFSSLAPDGALRGFAIAVMLAMCAALLAHAVPGFANPKVLDGVRLSADAAPYTKYLNFDKGVMGLFVLGLVTPQRAIRSRRAPVMPLLNRFAIVAGVVMVAAVAVGYARWDPKLPPWWPLWLWSMIVLTALPEEAVFRHVIQGGLQSWLGNTERARWTAMLAAGALFGLAHVGGGWTYVALATLAGIGYGWIYAVSGSLVAAVLAHTGLNLLHLLLFSYPALQRSP